MGKSLFTCLKEKEGKSVGGKEEGTKKQGRIECTLHRNKNLERIIDRPLNGKGGKKKRRTRSVPQRVATAEKGWGTEASNNGWKSI